jgi:hypothetical protein
MPRAPRNQPCHQAYVLWLVREGIAHTWAELCAHFGLNSRVLYTGEGMLLDSIQTLEAAGLLQAADGFRAAFENILSRGDITLDVTPALTSLQNALGISLRDLAMSDPAQRLLVTPILTQTFSSRYKSDILVLMPFDAAMRPIYDDHITSLAKRLNKSVSRADDFFTSERIMEEIWTALINTSIVIADCTARNPNVFYEIGLAHAIGKPTVLITQTAQDVPFDLRHRRYIEYSYTPRGMKDFEARLEQTIRRIWDDNGDAA